MSVLAVLFTKVVLPEIVKYFEERRAAGLPPPTVAEIEARLDQKIEPAIARGEAFLRGHE